MNKKVIGVVLACAGVAMLGVCGFTWKEYNRYEPKELTLELGDQISSDPAVYVEGNERAVQGTKLDTSKVDNLKEGSYTVTASYKGNTVHATVKVKDTTAPTLALKEEDFQLFVGQELKAADIIRKAEDNAGIKEISFDQGQIAVQTDSKNPVDQVSLKFDTAGKQTITLTVTDTYDNTKTAAIRVKVIENYASHVQGFHDLSLTQGETPDWMAGITKDEKVLEVIPDPSGVDVNTPGEYTLKYSIKGDDKETVVETTVKVTVLAPAPAPANDTNSAQNAGNRKSSAKSTGEENKKSGKSSGSKKSTSSGSASASSGGSSNSGGSAPASGGSDGEDIYSQYFTPGQTWESTTMGDNYDDPDAPVHAEWGTW